MKSDKIFLLQQQATEIFGSGKIDPHFNSNLKKLSESLLSSQTSDPNSIKITAEFQGLIYCLCKLCIVSYDDLSDETFFLVFRTILALSLHFYAVSSQSFSQFVEEFPDSFVVPYVSALIEHFFTNESDLKLQLISIASLLHFLFFSDDPKTNPFFHAITNIEKDAAESVFNSLERCIDTTVGISMFYALFVYNESFRAVCLSHPNMRLANLPFVNPEKGLDQTAELRINVLLILTKDPNFSTALSENGVAPTMIRNIFVYARHSLKDEHLRRSVMKALHICVNLAQKLKGFDSDTAEMMIGLIRVLQASKSLGDVAAEYCRVIVLFIESILVNRAEYNIELLYCVMRATDTFRKMSFMKEKSKDPFDFARSLVNVDVIAEYFSQRLLEMNDKLNDYDSLIKYLVAIIPDWKPTNIMTIPPPSFDYQCNDLKPLLKFFKFVILKEVPKIL